MQNWQIALAVAVVALMALGGLKAKGNGLRPGDLKRKTPLTKREQAMFFRLTETFPELVVLTQVSFSALISGKTRTVRNRFDRKYADFVLCTKAFEVVAVVELDDASHKGREAQDKERASLLTAVGYALLRFKQVPNASELLEALTPKEAGPVREKTIVSGKS